MIPKIIHYCWFGGGEMPEKDKKCIESWRHFCPDYEIIRWDESNYDVTKNRYMREAYEAKKWGFVSDYARMDIVYEHGGIYLDTDVELIKNLDPLLQNKAFMSFENGCSVNTGLGFGAEKQFPLLKTLMDRLYAARSFKLEDGEYDMTPVPAITTEYLLKIGLKRENRRQEIADMVIYPSEFFCPVDFATNRLSVTENTYSIHHYHASWHEPEEQRILQLSQKLTAKYGKKKARMIGKIIFIPIRLKKHLRIRGLKGTVVFLLKKYKRAPRGY